jgi:hypothetical protein
LRLALGKNIRPYLKNKPKKQTTTLKQKKGWRSGSSSRALYLASVKLWVQPQYCQKLKKDYFHILFVLYLKKVSS